jgi:DNA-directed RNA polymerase subunit RPC12/RpoP
MSAIATGDTMNRTNWRDVSGRRLDFGRFARMEYIVASILGVVILAAVVFAISSLVGDPIRVRKTGPYRYKCNKCGHEFARRPEEFPSERSPSDGAKKLLVDCPKCQAVASAWRLTPCPSPQCGKSYASDLTKARYASLLRGIGEPAGVQEKCPHCGTVVAEWNRQHAMTR